MEKKKIKKKTIIIFIIILIISVVVGVSGYFGYQYWENNQTTGTDWGDTYVEYLQDKISNNEYANAKEGSLEFIQLAENKKPTMILSYENDADKIMEITIMDENGKTTTKKVQAENGEELNMDFLYSVTSKEYNWYEHEKRKDGSELFIRIEEDDIKNGTGATEDKKHEFTKEEMTKQEVAEGETPSISKFEEEFVRPEITKNKIDIDLKGEIDKKELKDKIKDAMDKYIPQDQIVTDKVKENVEKSLKELENIKEKIKQVEENAKNKETENGILVNGNLLKYGKYEGTVSGKTYILIINSDKTYEIELPYVDGVKKGNVTVEQTETYDGTTEEHIVFGNDYWGIVSPEGYIQSQTVIDFHYVGNATETTQTENDENDKKEVEESTKKQQEENAKKESEILRKSHESAEKAKKAAEEEQKRMNELAKQTFNIQYESFYKGNQNGDSVKDLLNHIVSSNAREDNKITVEMNGISTTNATQINKLRDKVTSKKSYKVSFGYGSNGYINKAIIK